MIDSFLNQFGLDFSYLQLKWFLGISSVKVEEFHINLDDGCQGKALSNGNSRNEGDLFIKYAHCFIICRHEKFMHDSVFHSIGKVTLKSY